MAKVCYCPGCGRPRRWGKGLCPVCVERFRRAKTMRKADARRAPRGRN